VENKEKTKEKIVKRRENKGMVLKKKVAIKLFKRRIRIEKVGNKNKEAAVAN
jgi:hypothetical protein